MHFKTTEPILMIVLGVSRTMHPAIGVEFEAIGGHAWVFRDGRWQSVAR
jgi:hypothetical protein